MCWKVEIAILWKEVERIAIGDDSEDNRHRSESRKEFWFDGYHLVEG